MHPMSGETFARRPSGAAVVDRLFCLEAMLYRCYLEELWAEAPSPSEKEELATEALDLPGMCISAGFANAFSATELALLQKAPGSWSRQEQIDISWRIESQGIFRWALGLEPELPGFDSQIDPATTHVAPDEYSALRKAAILRDDRSIDLAREQAELWHWRSRTGAASAPGNAQAAGLLASGAKALQDRLEGSPPIDGDFPATGRPYRELSPEEREELRSIAAERHYALNWLCGYSDDWDRVPTDT